MRIFIPGAREHQYWYSHNCMVCWLSTKEMCIMTPQFFCMGVGVRLDMEWSVYIWNINAPYIYTEHSIYKYMDHYIILYIRSTAFVHRALHIYTWIMAFMEHSIYKWSSAFLCGSMWSTPYTMYGALHLYMDQGFFVPFWHKAYSTTFTLDSMTLWSAV